MSLANRDLRQRDILPPDRLKTCNATVVGVGAIGRQVALQLAAIGVNGLSLIDPDKVEDVNLACQGYYERDLGHNKVDAVDTVCQQLNPDICIPTLNLRFLRHHVDLIGNILFCCVDSITDRRFIWESVKDTTSLFLDARMSAETVQVYTAHDAESHDHYGTTLFSQSEAHSGACTAKSTIFCANIAAGFMVAQFSKWLRGIHIDPHIELDLLANELEVITPKALVPVY